MYPVLKRTLDILIATLLIVLTSPVLAVVAIAVATTSPGGVFYRGVRVGQYGRRFRVLKFRTMVDRAEELGGGSTADDDPRIIRVGAFLRRYKLDELPQLFNVLAGQMSLVGPRPQVEYDVARYSPAERALLSVRPGITDYASIRFRNEGEILRGQPDPDEAYIRLIRPEKIRLGLEYVRTRSLRVDLHILWLTALALVGLARQQERS